MNIKSIYLLFIVSFVLAACTKDNSDSPMDKEFELGFNVNAVSSSNVRSVLIDDASDLYTQGLSLYARYIPAESGTPEIILDNSHLAYDSENSRWHYTPRQFWYYGSYTFVALYPYMAGLGAGNPALTETVMRGTMRVDSDLNIIVENFILNKDTPDVLFVTATRTQSEDKGIDPSMVPLTMKHTAAAVGFRLRNTSGTDITAVSDIRLTGLKHEGNVTFSPDAGGGTITWEPSGDIVSVTDYITYSGTCTMPEGGLKTDALYYHPMLGENQYFIVVPQRLPGADITLSFTYTKGGSTATADVNLSSIETLTEWQIGKKYIYDITVTNDNILFEIHVVDWVDDDIPLE